MMTVYAMALGFALDALIGDPHSLPHPVRLNGALIAGGEKLMRKLCGEHLFAGGAVLAVMTVAVCFAVPWAILLGAGLISPWLRFAIETIFCYQIMAARSLTVESMRVVRHLDDIDEARKYLSWIVGRDTEDLDRDHIIRATVETVAENTSDGVIAPMLFMAIGGAPLAFAYKAVNTMDSMIGYKNEKYMLFGRFAARLDDVVNYIPARLSAFFMIAVSGIVGLDTKNAARIYKRDRRCHKSPNSAQTEAVAAGALRVELAGSACYFGKLVEKPTIGDAIRPIEPLDVARTNRLMYGAAILALLLFDGARALIMVAI